MQSMRSTPSMQSGWRQNRPNGANRCTRSSGLIRRAFRVSEQLLRDVGTMFPDYSDERDYVVPRSCVRGKLPDDLRGTYIRNGAGKQPGAARHFLDGDGCVLKLAFPGNGAAPRLTTRFVRTAGYVASASSATIANPERNVFTPGAAPQPLDLGAFKNVANTGVLYRGGRLWALWEAGLPHELCPRTLRTLGASDVDGQLETGRLGAHFRVDAQSGRCVCFSASVGWRGTQIEFLEFDERMKARSRTKHVVSGSGAFAPIHDFALTPRWYVLLLGPVAPDWRRLVNGDYSSGRVSLAGLLRFRHGEPSRVLLVPRPSAAHRSQAVVEALGPSVFAFHHVSARETGRASVMLDTVAWDGLDLDVTPHSVTPEFYGRAACRSHLVRVEVDAALGRSTCERLVRRTLEFPATCDDTAFFAADAIDHETRWGPPQALLKVSGMSGTDEGVAKNVTTSEWRPGPRCFVQEPIVVASEKGGLWVLIVVHDAGIRTSRLAVLDARAISAGPVAEVDLQHTLPYGLHGLWTRDVLLPARESEI